MPQEKPITGRHDGSQHGPITRLIDPSALGDALKPFVFLDFFNAPVQRGFGFGMHPHSGIATLTWQPGCDVRYQDTTGQNGVLKAGGLEWMNAGGGAWHQGSFDTEGQATGFQLWVAMPPGVEDGESFGQYVPPQEVQAAKFPGGELRVLLGQRDVQGQTVGSAIEPHHDMHYLVLTLEAHATWHWAVPAQHEVCWAFPFEGCLLVNEQAEALQLLTFGAGAGLTCRAGPQGARVLLGSARKHMHPLVLGPSSVHTNEASLLAGRRRIQDIGRSLKSQGAL
ncbi:pirin family protein [Roseateles sp. BYS180W]|uniref:Pirin family protein n=1 Tax=Roseateles rivi TaxID=3299028 RepID=A0ABW7FZ78_9BURK